MGKCRHHGNPLQSQRAPTVAWKPSAPTLPHCLAGRNRLQTINQGVGPFYAIGVGPFYVVKATAGRITAPWERGTLSTHGRREPVTGSVKMVSDGPEGLIGVGLRFDLPGIRVLTR